MCHCLKQSTSTRGSTRYGTKHDPSVADTRQKGTHSYKHALTDAQSHTITRGTRDTEHTFSAFAFMMLVRLNAALYAGSGILFSLRRSSC
ncbi:unnamed protein product [Ectocarpus sp. CCAP 1310/34]|nr:unnamed protein product [Ectocarpus sp. CCAP 1310/34]